MGIINRRNDWEEKERERLSLLYQTYQSMMLQVAMSVLHHREDAEDAVQNSIIAMSRHMDKIGEIEDYRTRAYIQTIVRNASIDIYRRKQKGDVSYDELIIEPMDTFNLEQVVCNSDEVRQVVKAIDALELGYREVLSLFYLNEMSPREIADVLDKPYNTVRSQINRGRKLLLKSLE